LSTFDRYARFYDLLNQGKDYGAETRYVTDLVESHRPGSRRILELGCGTGRHAQEMALLGYDVFGVDRSQAMVSRAWERHLPGGPVTRGEVEFHVADICSLQLPHSFDVATALFHVISYQTADAALDATFDSVRRHLLPGGLFLFDYWYGPAVQAAGAEKRERRFEDEQFLIVRTAEPRPLAAEHVVVVQYHFDVLDKSTGNHEEFTEAHPMRYLFDEDVEELLGRHGFEFLRGEEWQTGKALGADTWGAVCVAQLTSGAIS
jgi:SAM-dependent methyltransferase